MIYLTTHWLRFLGLISLVTFAAPSFADCQALINTPNKKLTWTILGAGGAKIATGRIIISKVTENGYFETRHSSGNNPAMGFYGGYTDDGVFMYLNPDYQELWIGRCVGNKITGRVKNKEFEITIP